MHHMSDTYKDVAKQKISPAYLAVTVLASKLWSYQLNAALQFEQDLKDLKHTNTERVQSNCSTTWTPYSLDGRGF